MTNAFGNHSADLGFPPNWLRLFLALAFLLPPTPLSGALKRSLMSRRGTQGPVVSSLGLWQNWLDFVRAVVGGYLLTQWVVVNASPETSDDFAGAIVRAAILTLAIVAQTLRVVRLGERTSLQLLVPVFFLCGLTIVFGWWIQGTFAMGVGWLFAFGGKNLVYHLPAMAIALAVAGYVLGLSIPLVLTASLITLPLLLAVLLRKRLNFATAVPSPA